MECKYLTPIDKKRQETNPELFNRFFCMFKISKQVTRIYLERNYNLILCSFCPAKSIYCSDRVSESFRAELQGMIKFFIKELLLFSQVSVGTSHPSPQKES